MNKPTELAELKNIYAYYIALDQGGSVVALDSRPHNEVRTAWLAAHGAFAKRMAREAHAQIKSNVVNKKIHEDEFGEVDDVEAPCIEPVTESELLTLQSPNGEGALSFMACHIIGIAEANMGELIRTNEPTGSKGRKRKVVKK